MRNAACAASCSSRIVAYAVLDLRPPPVMITPPSPMSRNGSPSGLIARSSSGLDDSAARIGVGNIASLRGVPAPRNRLSSATSGSIRRHGFGSSGSSRIRAPNSTSAAPNVANVSLTTYAIPTDWPSRASPA